MAPKRQKSRPDSVELRGEIGSRKTRDERGKTMDIRTHETTRTRAEYAQLTRHYRAIGPAAILAALLFRRPARNALPSR
jgi:hypothetical protein